MSDAEDAEDIDQKLEDLKDRAEALCEQGLFRSKDTVSLELKRLAKSEGRLKYYLGSLFDLINFSEASLNFQRRADLSIELIALLENEDHARLIQPDLPEHDYAVARNWMTTCAYDSLAVATGHLKGFNSDGLHNCINDGLEICRRMGKPEDVAYFRGTATEIYRAADDLEMAHHFARMRETNNVNQDNHGMRWSGVYDQARIELMQGDLETALTDALRAWNLAPIYHAPEHARRDTFLVLTTVLIMLGREAEIETLLDQTGIPLNLLQQRPAGEDLEFEYLGDLNESLRLALAGRWTDALAILHKHDRFFSQRKCLHEWFEVRLRVIAAMRLSGADSAEIASLAKDLEARASTARDWLTLRRLRRLLDPAIPATPLALVGDVLNGPTAIEKPTDAIAETPPQDAEPPEPELTPLGVQIDAFYERLREAEPDDFPAVSAAIQGELLEIAPDEVASEIEAAALLYLARGLAVEGSDLQALWAWVTKLAARFPKDANLINQRAKFGAKLTGELNVPKAGELADESLEAMFRKSLDLDPDDVGNFTRAGTYYLEVGKDGEAERCLARAFRLERSSGYIAKKLADLYSGSDRSRDALAVLDLCLREGSDDPAISWDAMLLATNLNQWEACLSYGRHYEANLPDQPWVNYYKATALLELGRGAEALEAAETEFRRNPEAPFPARVLAACALSVTGDADAYRERLTAILGGRLSEVTYLTNRGLVRLHELLWRSAKCLEADEPLRGRLTDHMLATGLAPNELFDETREGGEESDDVNFYHVVIDQPLDEDWAASHACLANQAEWTAYRIVWGVLARDEAEALEIAMSWQSRSYPIAPNPVLVEVGSEGFRDVPGIVWQGLREPPPDAETA